MNRVLLIVVLLVAVLLATAHAQTAQRELADAIEITSVEADGVNLRIHNTLSDSFRVIVCDTPQRLCGHSNNIELFNGKEWKRATPTGVLLGDLVGTTLEIPAGQTAVIPLRFSPTLLGITKGMKLRVVVRASQATVTGTQWLRLISPAFAFKPRKATKQ